MQADFGCGLIPSGLGEAQMGEAQMGVAQMGEAQMGTIMDTIKGYWTDYKMYILLGAAGLGGFLFLTKPGRKLIKLSNPRRHRRSRKHRR